MNGSLFQLREAPATAAPLTRPSAGGRARGGPARNRRIGEQQRATKLHTNDRTEQAAANERIQICSATKLVLLRGATLTRWRKKSPCCARRSLHVGRILRRPLYRPSHTSKMPSKIRANRILMRSSMARVRKSRRGADSNRCARRPRTPPIKVDLWRGKSISSHGLNLGLIRCVASFPLGHLDQLVWPNSVVRPCLECFNGRRFARLSSNAGDRCRECWPAF